MLNIQKKEICLNFFRLSLRKKASQFSWKTLSNFLKDGQTRRHFNFVEAKSLGTMKCLIAKNEGENDNETAVDSRIMADRKASGENLSKLGW
jgi:hypothetical protein